MNVWDTIWTADQMHVLPPDDVIGHELDVDCVCGPWVEELGGGDIAVLHHALDDRP